MKVHVYFEDRLIIIDYADIYRLDLHKKNISDGCAGFDIYVGDIPKCYLKIIVDDNVCVFQGEKYLQDIGKYSDKFLSKFPSYIDADSFSLFASFDNRPAALLVIFSITAFFPRIQRHQQMAYEFDRRGFFVIYIEPIFCRGSKLKVKKVIGCKNLYSINLPKSSHSYIDFIFAKTNQTINYFKHILTDFKLYFSHSAQVLTCPNWIGIIQDEKMFDVSIFDYVDDYSEVFGRDLSAILSYYLERSDFVTYTSARLPQLEALKPESKFQIRNGFRDAPSKKPKKYTFGYCGAIDTINGKWLHDFFGNNSDRTSVVIGSGASSSIFDEGFANMSYLGELGHHDSMAEIAMASFGLISFKSSYIASWVNPVKFYEYISFGLPVLASNLVDVEDELIEFANVIDSNKISSVDLGKFTNRFNLSATRLDFNNYSWSHRVDSMIRLFF